jgi:hypothetical protein
MARRGQLIAALGLLAALAILQPVPARADDDAADDAAHDIDVDHFYSRPGASRAQYEADWQECRLFARGTPPPSPLFPSIAGPSAMAQGLLPALLNQSASRRFSRHSCLLQKGWGQYTLAPAEKKAVQSLSKAEQSAYFDRAIGTLPGNARPYGRTGFVLPEHLLLPTGGATQVPGTVYTRDRADPSKPILAGSGEAVVVLAFRRVGKASNGRPGRLVLLRYDRAKRELSYPADEGDLTTYAKVVDSDDRNSTYEVHILRLTAGDYVIASTSVSRIKMVEGLGNMNCLGAPLFRAEAGQTVYLGDFIPYYGAKLSDGGWLYGLGYSRHIDDARATLATRQPALAQVLQQAPMYNQARFTCLSGVLMDQRDLPGLKPLPDASSD